MTVSTIPFATKAMGYDPEQVDKYYQKIACEYSNLQHSYEKLRRQYNALVEQSSNKMDAIAQAMVDAEVQAMKLVSDAKAEASKIMNDTLRDLTALRNEKAFLISEINNIIGKLKSVGAESEQYQTSKPFP